jgi:hypothetical protein
MFQAGIPTPEVQSPEHQSLLSKKEEFDSVEALNTHDAQFGKENEDSNKNKFHRTTKKQDSEAKNPFGKDEWNEK